MSAAKTPRRKPRRTNPADPTQLRAPVVAEEERRRLRDGEHTEPHRILGTHPAAVDGIDGVVVRAFHPDAIRVEWVAEDAAVPMEAAGDGLFSVFLPGARLPLRYRYRFHFADGAVWERGDPYRFLPTLGDMDLYLFNEGTHRRLWKVLGAHCRYLDGERGVSFSVWAPNARRVSVVGDFCAWDGRLFPMREMGSSGIFELFIPDIGPGALYKFEILTGTGDLRIKTDPYAQSMELPPESASQVYDSSYRWGDSDWAMRRGHLDPLRERMIVYEMHLGSWRRVPEERNRPLNYREAAHWLVDHLKPLGFTHVELLPVMEHPFDGSWGYQVTGYFAPTARYGTPDDFRYFVDYLHRHGLGVILDWVPGHFPKDDWALRRFDGTALYEHEDPRLGEHPDWGTLIFNYGRNEVRNFLLANALYWLDEFHVDGLRVDAVASMLYLDYSRKAGEWLPNREGGRENLEAIETLRAINQAVQLEHPGCVMIAEESTSWSGVTRSVAEGGLGFTFKWNMGWMHDTLQYFARDPVYRRHHQDQLTFAMVYESSEHFLMPLSHDEVVHGKGSLLGKMPGDPWQKFANLRLLLAYMYTRPGKKLLFMGTELAPEREWDHDRSLDWHLENEPLRAGLRRFLAELGELYHELAPFWRGDPDRDGFRWIDCTDRDQSVITFLRSDGEQQVLVILNLTPMPRSAYRIGVPVTAIWRCRFDSDARVYGGSDFPLQGEVESEPLPQHGFDQSLALDLPPLSALVFVPR